MAESKQVANSKTNAMAMYEGFENYGGEGFSDVTTEDLAIPFLRILESMSPQVNERDGAYVKNAKAGMIYNNVLNEAYDGIKGIRVIPCHYNRRFVEWVPREKGGGYIGSYEPTDPILQTTTKNEKGQDVLPSGNTLTNTAQFFVLFLHPEMGSQRALIPMSSTQLKKARKWLTQAQSMTAMGKNGPYILPLMSQIYTLSTVPEQNDKGSWFGWQIERSSQLDLQSEEQKALFDSAYAFAKSVKSGEVQIKEEAPSEVNQMPQDKGIM